MQMGLTFDVRAADIDETLETGLPVAAALEALAKRKALAVAQPGYIVISADTEVILDGQALGKPADGRDAARMLRALSGRAHDCVTAYCVLWPDGRCDVAHETVRVFFAPLEERDIRAYVETGEPLDKAGAYGIQGRGGMYVQRIEGDYYSVMGLPLCGLRRMLRSGGVL